MIEENTCVDTTPKYTLPYLIIIISGEYMLKSTVIGSSQNKKKQTISIVRQLLTQTHALPLIEMLQFVWIKSNVH